VSLGHVTQPAKVSNMEPTGTEGLSSSQVEEIVHALFQGFFDRAPQSNGLRYWVDRIEAGESALSVLRSLLLSPEHRARKALGENAPDLSMKLAKAIEGITSVTPLVIVDVGAQTMEREAHVYSPLLSHAKGRVIGFEPLEHRRRERELAETNVDLSMRAAFIADGNRHTFHLNSPDATSSLLPLNNAVLGELVDLCSFETVSMESVATISLDEAISDVGRVDFLKLDIQGFEHAALANARSVLSRTLAVHCEVEFLPLYQGQPLFSEIDLLLRESGFRFVDFNDLRRYSFKCGPLASRDQLVWTDAVYFKEAAMISDPVWLLIQAFIAAAVYGKLSLARLLVQEYDHRAGTSYDSLCSTY
jgi:FkbM family methyltransferase